MTTVVLLSNWILIVVIPSFVNCQESSCSDESMIQSDVMRRPLTNDTYEVIVRYCSKGIWHYLCSGGHAWTPTLATVACRQMGYSDQGAMLGVVGTCYMPGLSNSFRLTHECVGNETSLELCPGRARVDTSSCVCSAVASITCQARGGEDGDTYTTTTHYQQSTTSPQSENITLTVTSTTSQEGTTYLKAQDNTTITAALVTVISFLLALVKVALIIVCNIVLWKKKMHMAIRNQGPSTKINECYTIAQLDDPATSTQPNYSSINPAYRMDAVNDEMTHSYDFIEQPQGTNNIPQFKAANTPVRMKDKETDFYDTEQHTYEVV